MPSRAIFINHNSLLTISSALFLKSMPFVSTLDAIFLSAARLIKSESFGLMSGSPANVQFILFNGQLICFKRSSKVSLAMFPFALLMLCAVWQVTHFNWQMLVASIANDAGFLINGNTRGNFRKNGQTTFFLILSERLSLSVYFNICPHF